MMLDAESCLAELPMLQWTGAKTCFEKCGLLTKILNCDMILVAFMNEVAVLAWNHMNSTNEQQYL